MASLPGEAKWSGEPQARHGYLIQVSNAVAVGQEVIQTVNARELHGFLGSNKQFTNWIQDRITKYGFVENTDFVCLTIQVSKGPGSGSGGHNKKDYHVSIDMAKELAMGGP